ncbi:ABC transporter permease [Sulfitobacter sp. S190]|uniref:ABC transporter permease n=1 Tax=Sulfitobacter sp. S190 TaxID=2867022 RepID=UPI0021A89CC7|nr:ABC transporter permease [Sulfitobacter sp. S190]UWR24450.1 ABC transporter permease [Sulfitobacter sp. S190]
MEHDIAPPLPVQPPRRRFASLRAIGALVLREMSTTNGRSPGGYIWAVLEPAGGIILLSLVFAAAFRNPPMGISFPMFYSTGMLPFLMFTDIHNKIAQALMYSRQLLAYPTVTFLDAIIARFVLNLMTQLMVAYIILMGCLAVFETRVTPNLTVIVEAFALTALLSVGIGVLNCYLFTRFEVMQKAWSILMRPMFIISGILFLFEAIPDPYADYLWYNPLIHVTGMMRQGFYGTYDATYVSPLYVIGLSLGCLALGLVLLRRHHRELLVRF